MHTRMHAFASCVHVLYKAHYFLEFGRLLQDSLAFVYCIMQQLCLKVLDANAVPHTGESEDSSDTEDGSETHSYLQAARMGQLPSHFHFFSKRKLCAAICAKGRARLATHSQLPSGKSFVSEPI